MPLKQKRIVDPSILVVSDAEQKLHAKIDLSDDDDLVTDLNQSAIEYVEDRLMRGFMEQTWELCLDHFPARGCPIEICRVPLLEVVSIQYIDTDGNTQTWDSSNYVADDKAEPAFIHEAYGKNWPNTREIVNAVTVTFKVGYEASPSDASAVPEKYKTAIKQLFANWYEYREPMQDKQYYQIPEHMEALLAKYELTLFG